MVMRSCEETEGGKDQPTKKKGRERKVMILVSNKLVNVFSSEEILTPTRRNREKNVGPVIPQISRAYNRLENVNL